MGRPEAAMARPPRRGALSYGARPGRPQPSIAGPHVAIDAVQRQALVVCTNFDMRGHLWYGSATSRMRQKTADWARTQSLPSGGILDDAVLD
jgi:hypothetical protein